MQLNSEHKNWLNSQKVTDSVIEDFGLYTNENDLIVFPVVGGDGDFIFNKYRRSPLSNAQPKYLYDKGGKVTLYGWNKAKDADTILITEGEKDCLVAWSHNIPAVTSTGGALSFQEEWVHLLEGKDIIICFDNDKPGGDGMAKIVTMLGLENVKVMFLPDTPNINDISDYVTSGGDLNRLIKTAKIIEDVEEDMDDRKSIYQNAYFHEAWIERNRKKETSNYKPDKKEEDEVLRAKQFPLNEIIEFNRQGKAICPWHNDKDGSLHFYPKTNTAYCFGCSKAVDSIEAMRQKHGVSFKEALKLLNK